MKERKSAKLKVLVVAFVLIFSGFAALVAIPGPVTAQDPTVSTGVVTPHETEEEVRLIDEVAAWMDFTFGEEDNVTVWFQYNHAEQPIEEGATTTPTVYEPADFDEEETPGHMDTFVDLDAHETYNYRAVLEFHNETSGEDETVYGDVEEFMIVTVTVTDMEDVPLEDAFVGLRFITPMPWEDADYTDEAGKAVYTVPFDASEQYFDYTITKTNYLSTNGTFTGPEYTVQLEERTEWEIRVGPVLYDDGVDEMPIEEADVTLMWNDEYLEGVTDGAGKVSFWVDFNAEDTTFTVEIFHPDYNPKTFEFQGFDSGEIYLTADVYDFAIGRVLDNDGNPLEDYRVLAEYDDYYAEINYTDEAGYAWFEALFDPTDVTFTVTLRDGDWTSRAFHVVPGEDIVVYWFDIGPVVDPDGEPLYDFRVRAVNDTYDYSATGRTDEDGHVTFRIANADPDEIEFGVTVTKGLWDGDEVYVFPGEEVVFPLYTFNIRVVDEGENPLEDYHVDLVVTDDDGNVLLSREAYTDADGYTEFQLFGDDPADEDIDLTVTLTKDDWVSRYIPVEPNEEIVVYWFDIGPVVDEDGDPIEGVTVTVEGPDIFDGWSITKHTDADGMTEGYKVAHFNPADGTYLALTHPDYRTRSISATPGEVLTMHDKPVVSVGPIVDRGGRPLRVEITLEIETSGEMIGSRFTDTDGMAYFDVDFDPEGTSFVVTIEHDDLDEDFEEFFTGAESGRIRLHVGEPSEIVVGPVVDIPGDLVEGATVTLHHGADEIGYMNTDGDGLAIFHVGFLPAGEEFTFTVDHPELEVPYEGEFTGDASGPVRIDINAPDQDHTVRVGPIRDLAGDYVDDATVTLSWNGEELTKDTDANGRAVFTVTLPYDQTPDDIEFTYTVEHDELVEAHVGTFEGDRSGAFTIDIHEPEPEEHKVTVGPIRDRAGKPVVGATVTLSWNDAHTAETDSQGRATFMVPVDPAETTFTYTVEHEELDEPHEGEFDGARSGGFAIEVGEEPTEETEISTALLGGIGALIIIIIIIIVVVMMKKKPAAGPEEEVFEEEFEEEEPLFEEEEEDLFEEEPLFEEEEEGDVFEEEDDVFEEEEEDLFEEEEEDLFEEEDEEF